MKDTSKKMQKIYHDMLMQKSGKERFLMGISMCATARKMVFVSVPKNISPQEKKILLLKRYYGNDLDEKTLQEFISAL